MKLGVVHAARKTGEWLKGKFAARGIILLYHRVTELKSDPQLLAVSPQHFAEHLEIVKSKCHPVPLKELVVGLKGKTQNEFPVAITFDDGYADNLAQAQPLLRRYGVPATVFVTAGYVESGREFWWDEIERLILEPPFLPETLKLDTLEGENLTWELGEGSHQGDAYLKWNVQASENPTPRHTLYRSLCELLRSLPEQRRADVLEYIRKWAGMGSAGRPTHLPVTTAELVQLDREALVEIGAHTCTHSLLSGLSKAEQKKDVQDSKKILEEVLNHEVSTFAYPFGGRVDYNGDSLAAVYEAGFELACANFPGAVWRYSDCFQLPRVLVRDWDGETFERWLSGWADG
ncbi:MAG TPA: polysaccharide deacetylase family protein [Candidatus Acidoferrales bacterium]|nr:polysaccharide deacetylase family protein [Candidatus Acidoferrales bacterium]